MSICAIHLFNHKFERVLPLLDRIYGTRFSHRHTIMPFASQPGPNVSRVHELGRNFSGHLAQAARDFIQPDFTHYVVIADDLLLNPAIDEGNLLDRLNLQAGEGYIKNLCAADTLRNEWIWPGEAAAKFRRNAKALDWKALLPSPEQAKAKFTAMGLDIPDAVPGSATDTLRAHRKFARQSVWATLESATMRRQPADYPFLSGYSDFLVIPAQAIADFTHYCGVFAAMDIFAEIAVPTALALACDNVRTEMALNQHFHWNDAPLTQANAMKGVELWTQEDSSRFASLLSQPLEQILAGFPEDILYIHPVKLSTFA